MFSLFRKPFTLSSIALLFLFRFSFGNHKKKTFVKYFSWALHTKHTRCLVRHFDSHWVKPLTTNTNSNSNFYNADLRDVATERLYTTVGYETVSRTELNRWLGPSQPERDSISAAPPAAPLLSPALSATLNSLFTMCCSPVACNYSAAFSLLLSLSLSLLMSFSLLCLRSRSLARGALWVVRLQWLLHLHRFAPVSRFLGNIIFLYLFFRHRCWQWALCQCRYCCSASSSSLSSSSSSSLLSLKVAFSLINRHFLHGYCHACALTTLCAWSFFWIFAIKDYSTLFKEIVCEEFSNEVSSACYL